MMAIILAAGVGKRLGPLSKKISKAMLPILGVPMAAKVIEQICSETPLRRFVVVVRDVNQDIALYLKKTPPPGAEIEFVVQPEPLGMADALKKVGEKVRIESDFLVSACDNLYEEGAVSELYRVHRQGDVDATICLLRMEKEQIAGKSAAVYLDSGRVVRIVEKPPQEDIETELASIPLYAFTPRLLEYIPMVRPSPRGEYELQDAIQMLIDHGGKVGYIVCNWRRTVTSAEDLLAVNLEMLNKVGGDQGVVTPGLKIEQPVIIEEGCALGEGSYLGPNVHIGAGCTIGKSCRLSHCVVLPGSNVPDGTQANHRLFC